MALPSTLQRSRSAVVYIKSEDVAGKVAGVPLDTDAFGLTSVPVIAQSGNYADTSEIGSELITTDRVLNYMDYSTFDLEFYAKPSGRTINGVSEVVSSATVASGEIVLTFGSTSHNIVIGDTIRVSGSQLDQGPDTGNGVFKVTDVSGADVTYGTVSAAGVAIDASATSVTTTPVNVEVIKMKTPPEHVILSKLFGGVKFNSVGSYVQGDVSDSDVSDANDQATCVSYFLKNSIETVSVHSLQETDTTVQYYVGKGALPTSFSISLAKDGPVTMSVGFQSNKVLYAGTTEVDAISGNATSTTVTALGPKRYASGGVTVGDTMWYESEDAQGTPVKVVSND